MKCKVVITNDNSIVQAHQLYKKNVLPGVVYLEIIFRYLQSRGMDVSRMKIYDIIFNKPVIASESYDKCLTITFTEESEKWHVRGSSRKVVEGITGVDEDENFTAKLDFNNHNDELKIENLQVEALKKTAFKSVSMEYFYEKLREKGLIHFDFMKLDGDVYIGEEYILAEVSLSPSAAEQAQKYYIHPAFLDSAAIPIGGFIFQGDLNLNFNEITKPLIPMLIEGFCSYRPIKSNKAYVYIGKTDWRWSEKTKILATNIKMYTEDGKLAAVFSKFTVKEIRSVETLDFDSAKGKKGSTEKMPSDEIANEQDSDKPNEVLSFIQQELKSMMARHLNRSAESISLDQDYFDMGLDSIRLLEILKEIENLLQKQLYPTLLFEHDNIRNLSKYLECEFGGHFN